jgi:hypothetical protein
MKEHIRELLTKLEKLIALFAEHSKEFDKKQFRKDISYLRKGITDGVTTRKGKPFPPLDYIQAELEGLGIDHRESQLKNPRLGNNPKADSIKHMAVTLHSLAHKYQPTPQTIAKPSPIPNEFNIKEWHDEYNYNVYDTPYRNRHNFEQAFQDAKREYETRTQETLYKRMCRKSEPVEHAPPPYGEEE